ncbi:MAG: hypothetical protein HKN88_02710, partial [Gammaproteobacteria bacterium]|nr:hypothetical protein [Gammaproteobacteria bacterium]
MRFLEISCLLFCLLAILSLGSQYPKLQKGLLTLSVVALALHLGIEGWRWQMVPVYVAISLLIFMTIRQTEVSGMLIGSKIAVLMLLSVPLFMLPIPSYPELSGAASVGTDSFDVVDNERGRVLPTKVWFPIDKPTLTKTAELQSAPWLEHQEKIGPVLARIAAMPGFIFNHLRHFKNGYKSDLKLAVANDKPLIVLSHGRGGIKEMNGFMAMEFASQGYIVIAPDHTKGAMYTVLQNGSEIPFDPKEFAEGENLPDPEYDQRIRELGQRWVQDLAVVTSYV